jgi:hypothetical protein
VVRGLAALLGLAAGAAYFLLVGELPGASSVVAGCAGAAAVALCGLGALPGREDTVALVVLGLGAALLATALTGQDVGAAANPVEALFAASAGLLFAQAFAIPAAVVALPILVGGIDAAAVLAGPDGDRGEADRVDVLTLDLPAWGGGESVGRLGFLDVTFLALFAAWALRFDLRPRRAIWCMTAALIGVVAAAVELDRSIPALPFIAAAFLLAAPGRLLRLVRGTHGRDDAE